MDRNTVVLNDRLETSDDGVDEGVGTRWQRFFTSRTLAVILIAACVVGLFVIVKAHSFSSASVSDRVSSKLGQPATCAEVGATQIAGKHSTIYKCTVGLKIHRSAQCFAITGGEMVQVSGTGERRC